MRLNDATPADWDRLAMTAPAIEKQATGLDAWMKAAHDEASEAWEEDAGRVDWEEEEEDQEEEAEG